MPIQTVTKSCPFCNKVYEQRSFSVPRRNATGQEQWQFGTPMRLCPNCKKLFIDHDRQELAITGPRKQDLVKINPGTRTLALMGLILGVLLFIAGTRVMGCIAALVGVLCAAADLAFYPTRMKKLENERKASEQRLNDPNYARALQRAGYEIPERYLKPKEDVGQHNDQ